MSSRTTAKEKAPRGREAASDVATTVLASIAIALPLLFYMRQHVEILRHGYEIQGLEERRAVLLERTRELSAQQLQAASLRRAEEQAPALGLVAPPPDHVLVATAGGATGAPDHPAPAATRVTARLE